MEHNNDYCFISKLTITTKFYLNNVTNYYYVFEHLMLFDNSKKRLFLEYITRKQCFKLLKRKIIKKKK